MLLNPWWWLMPVLLWASLVAWSLWSNIESIRQHHFAIAEDAARNMFRVIEIVRLWNARHGGVYVPVTSDTQPNPYLVIPDRDVTTVDQRQLTLVNPAYMTRQISELFAEDANTRFHITSLKPIRPENRADAWEAGVLELLERGRTDYAERITDGQQDRFRYMSRLVVEQSCLKCHAYQGFKAGDINGGISVTFDAKPIFGGADAQIRSIIVQHLMVFVLFSALMVFFFANFRRRWLDLQDIELHQADIIRERTRQLEHLATHDPLTGLFNRNALEKQIAVELDRTHRYRHTLSVFMLDIDHFKRINDQYGHLLGDAVLSTVANVIESSLRKTDFVARYGGEEFVVILPETEAGEAEQLAEKMRRTIAQTIFHSGGGKHLKLTASIGIATYPLHADSWEALLDAADQSMYAAKEAGRDRVMVTTR